jgi:hypothetical protein
MTLLKAPNINLQLKDAGHSISKSKMTSSGSKVQQEGVQYVYVDQDVTITLGEETVSGRFSVTYKAATLRLTKGWNALHSKTEGSLSDMTGTVTMAVGNPDLNWAVQVQE